MKDNNWIVPKTFELTLFDGHPIILSYGNNIYSVESTGSTEIHKYDARNYILIDTGAPKTIHAYEDLFFCEKDYSCYTNYNGITVEKLSEVLGMKITTLLGVDILSNYIVMLDYKSNVVKFYGRDIEFEGKEYNLSSINGIPIIELEIEQQPIKLFLDTGAKISYLPKEYTSNFKSVGIESDFHPNFGIFQTECFDIKTTFGNK